MTTSVRELLQSRVPDTVVGRARELAILEAALEDDGAIVTWLDGLPGIGKSQLIDLFEQSLANGGRQLYSVDCRLVEPTPAAVEVAVRSTGALDDKNAVLVFDNYESFRLVDAWMRRSFVPTLPTSTRVVLVSRETPSTGWLSSAAWQPHFKELQLGPLDEEDVTAYLEERGVDDALRVARWSQGHPLAMALAANSTGSQYLDSGGDTLERLAACFLADTSDPCIRKALEACSVTRRITRPLLDALCEGEDTDALYSRLAELSFVDKTSAGLAVHELLREAIAARLRAADPGRFRACQQAAWRLHRGELKSASDLWRSTSDTIYLLSNPVIREAFFPSEAAACTVEPAQDGDRDAIFEIAREHEPAATVAALELWWRHLPSAFHVVRGSDGGVDGFYCLARPNETSLDWLQQDPVARAWKADLDRVRAKTPAIFIRRWLSRQVGEAPHPVQAAAWIDIKRTYLELRPALRRVYLCLHDLGPFAEAATQLGFVVLDSAAVDVDGQPLHTAMLDFGPGSVDGWINGLLSEELGASDDQLLDHRAHELVLGDERIALTPLEYGVVSLLESRGGEPVERDVLIREVWGRDYTGGSNVVDAVIRGLRKKCGDSAGIVETVRGVGYRLGSPQSS